MIQVHFIPTPLKTLLHKANSNFFAYALTMICYYNSPSAV
jgi:hypothetical protein